MLCLISRLRAVVIFRVIIMIRKIMIRKRSIKIRIMWIEVCILRCMVVIMVGKISMLVCLMDCMVKIIVLCMGMKCKFRLLVSRMSIIVGM